MSRKHGSCLAAYLLSVPLLFAASVQAEPYVAAQVGVTFPGDLTNVEGIQSLQGLNITDLSLKTSVEEGLKIGYFLPGSLKWLGFETEAFYTNPHLKQQNATFSGSLPGIGPIPATSATIGGAHTRMATWAFNLIARYPGIHFQPYAGVGLGIFWARVSGNDAGVGTASDTSPGLNVLAGLRYLVTQHVAVFTEYKYNRATFDFGNDGSATPVDFKADYSAHHIVFGVGYHF